MINQLMIKELITLNYLKEGNREEALKMCKDYKISQYRFSELEKMAVSEQKCKNIKNNRR